jgi:hypothetical protein
MGDIILKDVDFNVTNLHGFNSFTNLLSFLCQWIAILIVIVGCKLRAYNISFISPVYSVFLSIYWVFSDSVGIDKPFFVASVLGVSLIFIILMVYLSKVTLKEIEKEQIIQEELKLLHKILDLNLLTTKKSSNEKK